MPNYQNGKIYTIRSRSRPDLVYVGSTMQGLAMRFGEHNRKYRKWVDDGKHDLTSFRVIEIGDAYVELLENFPCNTREELHAREGYHMREIECVNKHIMGRTPREYRQDNKERLNMIRRDYYKANKEILNAKSKEYHIENKEDISAQRKQYREINRDEINLKQRNDYIKNREVHIVKVKEYAAKNKDKIRETQKIYNANNKDRLSQYRAKYREDKKESIRAWGTKRVECPYCNITYTQRNKQCHMKSIKHIANFIAY